MPGIQEIRGVGGRQIALGREMWEVIDRIQNGDATLNWSGDRAMFVAYNEARQVYEVWRRGSDGRDRIIVSAPPNEFDQRIVMKLAAGDMWARGRDVLAEIDAHNDSIERDAAREAEAMEDEMRDIVKHYHKRNS